MNQKRILLPVLTCAALAVPANAATYIVTVNALDAEVANDTTPLSDGAAGSIVESIVKTPLLIGAFNAKGISVVLPFELPTLAPGETITGATLTFTNGGRIRNPSYNADLYGIGYRTTADVIAADYFVGALDATNATLIQDNIFIPGTSALPNSTSTTGDAALVSYLTAQYVGGAVGGNFVHLRFSPDNFTGTSSSSSVGYFITSAESATDPVLTITTIPEPSAAGLLGAFGALALVFRQRAA